MLDKEKACTACSGSGFYCGRKCGACYGTGLEYSKDDIIEALEAENEKLRKDSSEVFIKELIYKDGDFNALMTTGFAPVFCEFVKEMMDKSGAENFTSFRLDFGGEDQYYIVAGRANGKSIQEKWEEVSIRNKELEAGNERLRQGEKQAVIDVVARIQRISDSGQYPDEIVAEIDSELYKIKSEIGADGYHHERKINERR